MTVYWIYFGPRFDSGRLHLTNVRNMYNIEGEMLRFDQKKKSEEKNGKPWDIAGKFSDYTGADIFRNGVILQNGDELEVKVKKMSDGFVVKTRRKKEENLGESKKKRSKKDRKGK